MIRQGLAWRPLRELAGESGRYAFASAIAFALDFGTYVLLIRLAGIPYLVAAPLGFALGLASIYALSVRWVFLRRRLSDRRVEFLAFGAIGIAGMALNQGILYAAVEWLSLSYIVAKFVSAGVVFSFNFGSRKLLLFTRP